MLAHLGQSAAEVHVGSHQDSYAPRVLADRFGYRIFHASDPRTGKGAVHINADHGKVVHDDTVDAFHTWDSSR